MRIQDVQSRDAGGCFAVVDGFDLEFTECAEPSSHVCDKCGASELWSDGYCFVAVLSDTTGDVHVCTQCLEIARL